MNQRKPRTDKHSIRFYPDHDAWGAPRLRFVAYVGGVRKFGTIVTFGHDERAALEWWEDTGRALVKGKIAKETRQQPAPVPHLTKATTFEAFAETWTNGSLAKAYPDNVKVKDSTRDEQALRLYINPVIGKLPINTIDIEHCEEVLARLPKYLNPHTRKLIAQCMSKVFSYAIYPARLIAHTPIIRGMIPKAPKARKKSMLYPAEEAKLLACRAIPLVRRFAYGVLMREGMRASELADLRWSQIDLDHGTITLDKNKTNDARTWKLSCDVAEVLAWWKKTNVRADDLVLGISLGDGAWWLRGDTHYDATKPESSTNNPGDLRRAGITRPQLWEDTERLQPIRLHDLRGSFVTLHLAAGKTEAWITDRTGHQSSEMIYTYKRATRLAEEIDLGLPVDMRSVLAEFPTPKTRKNKGSK